MNYLDDMTNSELAQVTKALQLEQDRDAEEAFGGEWELPCEQDGAEPVMNENEDATTQISASAAAQ